MTTTTPSRTKFLSTPSARRATPAAWQDDEEDEEDEDPDFLGASWVVTLTFRSSRDAQRWIDRMGYDATAKAGKKTTVIRMEE